MSVEVVFVPNPIQEREPRLAQHLEEVVLAALGNQDPSAPGPIRVRFQVWEGEEVLKYVCKVECASVRTIDMAEPPWRWWSPLFESPLELAAELREALALRQARRRTASEPAGATLAPAETWGWGAGLRVG